MKWNRWKMKLKNIDTQQHGFSDGLKSSNIFLKKTIARIYWITRSRIIDKSAMQMFVK